MPQLKSGRHVGVSIRSYIDALTAGQEESMYFAIVALRLNVVTPEALRDHVLIVYFDESKGAPPHAPAYSSGYCVADVLEGRTDWSLDEVEEFRAFLTEPRFAHWLQAQFDALNQVIRDHPLWALDWMDINETSNEIDARSMARVLIQKSAMEPDAMAHLRPPRHSP
jgi:hypothetical protein